MSQFQTIQVRPMAFDLLGEEKLCPSHPENGANTGRRREGCWVTFEPLDQAKPEFILCICYRSQYTPSPLFFLLTYLSWVVCFLKIKIFNGYRDAIKVILNEKQNAATLA